MRMSCTTAGMLLSAQSLRAKITATELCPHSPAPSPPNRPPWLLTLLHGCAGGGGSLWSLSAPGPPSPPALPPPGHWAPPRPEGSLQTCLLLQAMRRGKNTIPHSEPNSPLARSSFSSVEVNRVSGQEGALHEALCTHKVLALPPPTPQQAGRKQSVLRMDPRSHGDWCTKGRARPRSCGGPSGESPMSF